MVFCFRCVQIQIYNYREKAWTSFADVKEFWGKWAFFCFVFFWITVAWQWECHHEIYRVMTQWSLSCDGRKPVSVFCCSNALTGWGFKLGGCFNLEFGEVCLVGHCDTAPPTWSCRLRVSCNPLLLPDFTARSSAKWHRLRPLNVGGSRDTPEVGGLFCSPKRKKMVEFYESFSVRNVNLHCRIPIHVLLHLTNQASLTSTVL